MARKKKEEVLQIDTLELLERVQAHDSKISQTYMEMQQFKHQLEALFHFLFEKKYPDWMPEFARIYHEMLLDVWVRQKTGKGHNEHSIKELQKLWDKNVK